MRKKGMKVLGLIVVLMIVGSVFGALSGIAIAPDHNNSISQNVLIQKGVSVPSTVKVLMNNGSVVIMDLDEYLKGVVAAEMSSSWPIEALKAQAVASRSFAIANTHHDHITEDVCTDHNCCQAWQAGPYSENIEKAVTETHNVVMTYNGEITKEPLFFGHCNGNTRNSEDYCPEGDCWTYVPYLRGVSCNCGFSSYYGHGVGMCQYGAKAMAEQGYNYADILKHYYTGIEVEGVNDSKVIYVPDDYSKIQWAVDNATEGDTIIVRDGFYIENVDINKRLTIKSENGTDKTIVQAGNPGYHVFEVSADNVTISGFTVTGATGFGPFNGISLHSADFCTISNNNCTSNKDYGIYLSQSNNCNVSNNRCSSNNQGIYLSQSNNNTLSSNNCSFNYDGIMLSLSDNNSISDNICLYNERYGIDPWYSSNNELADNTLVENGLVLFGYTVDDYTNDIDESNTVNGKPIYYKKDVKGGIIPNGAGQVILVNCSNVTVENQNLSNASIGIQIFFSTDITIKNNNCSNNKDEGIDLRYSDDCTISDNNCFYNRNGISLLFSNNNSISKNNLSSNYQNGVDIRRSNNNHISDNIYSGNEFYGIYLGDFSTGNDLTNNIFTNNSIYLTSSYCNKINLNNLIGTSAIRLGYSSNNVLSNNNASGSIYLGYGIYLGYSSNNVLTNNKITNTTHGIGIDLYSQFNILDNNTVSSNLGSGIILSSSSHNTITNNTINSNSVGISIYSYYLGEYGYNNTLAYNNIRSNDFGIGLYVIHDLPPASSDTNMIYHNNFINNTVQAYDNISNNSWDNGYPSGGNYYSNYLGVDLKSGPSQDQPGSDGIGDTSYPIPGGSSLDRYPLMERFENYIEVSESPWPMFRNDPKGTGQSKNIGPQTNNIRWIKNIGQPISKSPFTSSQPIIGTDETIYIAISSYEDGDGQLYAFNPDGTTKWVFDLENIPGTPATDSEGNVYIGTIETDNSDAKIFAIDFNGNKKWEFSQSGARFITLSDEGTLYFSSIKSLYALNSENGEVVWHYESENRWFSQPAIGPNNTLYAVYPGWWNAQDHQKGALYAFDSKNGALKWTAWQQLWWGMSAPVVDNQGNIYTAGDELFAFDSNGNLKWKQLLAPSQPNWIRQIRTPWLAISSDNTIIAGGRGTYGGKPYYVLRTYNLQGEILLEFQTEEKPTNDKKNPEENIIQWYSQPILDNQGNIFIYGRTWDDPARYSRLYSINKDSGNIIWHYDLNWWQTFLSLLAIGDNNHLYITYLHEEKDEKQIKLIAFGPILETCFDGIKNFDESDIDCGGFCSKCEDNKNCNQNSNCLSDFCEQGICKYQDFSNSPWQMLGYNNSHTSASHLFGPENEDLEKRIFIGDEDGEDLYGNLVITPTGNLYCAAVIGKRGGIYSFNPDGSKKWFYEVPQISFNWPAVGPDGSVYFLSRYGVIAIDSYGRFKWKSDFKYLDVTTCPVVGENGVLYVTSFYQKEDGSFDNAIFAISSDEERLWEKSLNSNESRKITSPSIGPDGTIYFGFKNILYAVNPDGSEKWSLEFTDLSEENELPNILSYPIISSGGIIYLRSNHLQAVSPEGQILWSYGDLIPRAISPDGTLYATTFGWGGGWSPYGHLYALDASSGQMKWYKRYLNNPFSHVIVDAKGNVYTTDGGTGIMALDSEGNKIFDRGVKSHRNHFVLGKNKTIFLPGHYAIYTLRPSISSNNPPDPPTNLAQFKSDSGTFIPVGDTTDERKVYFKGTVSDPDGDKVKLQVELRRLDEYGGQFDETKGGLKDSVLVESGSEAVAYADGLIDADYHWRARTVDEHGEPSEWIDFGDNDISEADFTVAGPTQLDLWVTDIKPIQTIQDIPLIKGKATMVRVSVDFAPSDIEELFDVTVELEFEGEKHTETGNLIRYNGKVYVVPDDKLEDFIKYKDKPPVIKPMIFDYGLDAFNFEDIGSPSNEGTIIIKASIDPSNKFNEINENNNFYSSEKTVKAFNNNYKVIYKPLSFWGSRKDFTDYNKLANFAEYQFEYFISTYPIPKSNAEFKFDSSIIPAPGLSLFEFLGMSAVYQLQGYDRVVFIIPEGKICSILKFIPGYKEPPKGLQIRGMDTFVLIDETASQPTVAHEIGHTYGYCEEYDLSPFPGWVTPECGNWNEDIYPSGYIAGDGWDVRGIVFLKEDKRAKISFDRKNPNTPNYNCYSFMGSLTGSAWKYDIINHWAPSNNYEYNNYNTLLEKLDIDADPRVLVVSGVIYGNDTVEFLPFYSFDGFPDVLDPGNYSFECLSISDEVLSTVQFQPYYFTNTLTGEKIAPFLFTISYPNNTTKIVLKHTDTVLNEVLLTPNMPIIEIISVNDLGNENHEIIWNASDVDGDVLTSSIFYSHDTNDWFPLVFSLNSTDNKYTFNTSNLPGGNDSVIKIVTTDGINTVEAISDPFPVSNKAPFVVISLPINGSMFSNESTIRFSASFYDPEAKINDSFWYSNVDGFLGNDSKVYRKLSIGEHTITFTAVDKEGLSSNDSINIIVTSETKPDLTVKDIKFNPKSAEVKESVVITAEISNIITDAFCDIAFYDGNPDSGGVLMANTTTLAISNLVTYVTITHNFTTAGVHVIYITISNSDPEELNISNNKAFKCLTITGNNTFFDTEAPANPYPSIMGNHTGTITPNKTIAISKLYTYPCAGTGGHTEYIKIRNETKVIVEANWTGYIGDRHNISLPESTLVAGETYNYTIRTGSYPQIHHNTSLLTTNGWINCTSFVDANGKEYDNWIPAIKLE